MSASREERRGRRLEISSISATDKIHPNQRTRAGSGSTASNLFNLTPVSKLPIST